MLSAYIHFWRLIPPGLAPVFCFASSIEAVAGKRKHDDTIGNAMFVGLIIGIIQLVVTTFLCGTKAKLKRKPPERDL